MEPSVRVQRTPRPPRSYQVPRAGFLGQGALALGKKLLPPSELFVLGRNVNQPLDQEEFWQAFPPRAFDSLRQFGLAVPSELQRSVASNLYEGSETVMVPKASLDKRDLLRRTMTYMLPILNSLRKEPSRHRRNPRPEEVVRRIAPSVLIVTPSEAIGYKLFYQLHESLVSNPFAKSFSIQCLTAAGYNCSADVDVLITDIKSIQQSRICSERCFSYARMKFLVFEDMQCYLREYGDDVKDTVQIARFHDAFFNEQKQLRLIVSSSRWNAELESFYVDTLDSSPIIYIESHTELTNFAKIKTVVDYLETFNAKLELLKDMMENKMMDHKKIAIACSTAEKAEMIADAMLQYATRVNVISSVLYSTELAVVKCREYENREIFIIIDSVLDATSVKNCTYFISFDGATQKVDKWLPVASLGLHFLWNSLPELQDVDPYQGALQRKNLVANYLLGGEDGQGSNIGDFYFYSKQLNETELTLKFEKLGEQIWNEYISTTPLCDGFKLFGTCNKPVGYFCYHRHEFNEQDLEATIPGCGEIEFRVVECDRRNLNTYKGKLMSQYTVKDGKRILMKTFHEELRLRSQLLKRYCHNKLELQEVTLNCVYGAPLDGTYLRVRALHVNPPLISNNEGSIYVHVIDEGRNAMVSSQILFNVPMEVTKLSPLIIDVILGSLCPPNNQSEFIVGGVNIASKFALGNIFRGKVWLSFGNTVWVQPMVKQDDPSWSLSTKLIASKAANFNSKHLCSLLESAKRLGPRYKYCNYIYNELETRDFSGHYQDFHKLNDQQRWAFLELDEKVLPIEIKVTDLTDPWLFHGIQSNFKDLLKKLEEDANAWVNALLLDRGTETREDFFNSLEQGRCVLVDDKENQRWRRALTTKKTPGKGEGDSLLRNPETFEVFLVDYGSVVKGVGRHDLLPISKELVNRLPFQAIAFSLNHVEPTKGKREWNVKDIDTFRKMIPEEDSYIHVTALKHKSANKCETQPNHYLALALHGGEELGTLLVKQSVAVEAENVADLVIAMQSKTSNSQAPDVLDEDDEKENIDDQFDVVMDSSGTENRKVGWLDSFIESFKSLPTQSTNNTAQVQEEVTSDKSKPGSSDKSQAAPSLAMPLDGPGSSSKGVLAIKANNDLLCPTVYWHQTKTQIVFMIQIVDVKDFNLKVASDGRTINFSAGNYGFTVKLFGKVLRQYSSFPTGQRLKVAFTKRNGNCDLWIRINQSQTEKLKWLKKDLDHLQESEDDDDEPEGSVLNTYSSKFEHSDDSVDSDDFEDKLFAAPSKYWTDEDRRKIDAEAQLQLNMKMKLDK